MTKIDAIIKDLKSGNKMSILQHCEDQFYWVLTYIADSFFLEKYKIGAGHSRLVKVEAIDESTARFSLSARY